MASNKNIMIAAVVTAAAAATAILAYTLTRPPKQKAKVKTKEDIKPMPFTKQLTREELCSTLQEITTGVERVIMELAQEEQSLLKNPENQKLTAEQLQTYLLNRFQQGVAAVEAQVYKKNNIKELQVKQATEIFQDDSDVKKAVQQLKSVYGAVMGGNANDLPAVPDFLTKEKTLEVLDETMKILRHEAKESVTFLKSKGIDRSKDLPKFQAEFQKIYGTRVEAARKKLYEANNINDDLLIQAAVVKYQGDLSFQQSLRKSSEAHNEEMAKLGFFAPGGEPKN